VLVAPKKFTDIKHVFLVLQCQGDCYTISEAQRFLCELLSPHLAFTSSPYLFVVCNCML